MKQMEYATELDNIGTYKGKGSPNYIAHWVLKTAQSKRMIEWYRHTLDAQLVFMNKMVAFMTFDNEHHRVAFVRLPWILFPISLVARFHRKIYGLDHIAFNFESLERLMSTYKRLHKLNIDPIWCINHGPTTSIYYEDPDGNRLEFQVDNFKTTKELQDFAASGRFLDNPIGVNFDPDVMLEMMEAGIPANILTHPDTVIVKKGKKPKKGYKTINWKTL